MEEEKEEEKDVEELFNSLQRWMRAAEEIILGYSFHHANCLIHSSLSCSCGFSQLLYQWKTAEADARGIFVKFDLKEN